MQYKKADLLGSVVGTYDQTKTTIKGNVFSKTIGGNTFLGPSLNKFMDVFADTGLVPLGVVASGNGRVFVITPEVATIMTIAMYSFNFSNGSYTYVGKITARVAEAATTTHTLRGLKVIDNGTTGWKIFITTSASVSINGGTFLVNNVDLADFTSLGTDFPFATGTNQKASYFLQDPANTGVGQLQITSAGSTLDAANNRLYARNGTATVYQYYVYDTSAVPTYVTGTVNVSVASPGKVSYTAHPFLANDPIVFTSGPLPTGLTVGTIYFVRNPTANDFEVSATSGGASINTTGSPSVGVTVGRAFGTVGSNFVHKTGNLPATTGTLISNDSDDYALPQHGPNSGFGCAFFVTSTTMYLGRLSELTAGAVTWPSLSTANLADSGGTSVLQTIRAGSWSNLLDRAVMNSAGSLRFIMKQAVNNNIDRIFGRANTSILEAAAPQTVYVGANTEANVVGVDLETGWLFIAINTVGQRGVIALDVRSDSFFDYSHVISKVLSISNATLKFIGRWRAYDNQTDGLLLSYRTSGFGSETGGWTPIEAFSDLSAISMATGQIQFKIAFDSLTKEAKGLHAQIRELFVGFESNTGISDNWEFSRDKSDNLTPSRCAFRLKEVYASSVPTLHFRAYDLSDALVVHHDTVTNAANFEYSTNNGVSWLPLGTIPNTVGTLIRYTFSSPPGVDIRPGLKES